MDIFPIIHEVAVIGSAVFMMAAASLWYSDFLFGPVWNRVSGNTRIVVVGVKDSAALALMLLGYVGVMAGVAFVLGITPLLPITAVGSIGLLWVVVMAALGIQALGERRSLLYYIISAGWISVVIFGGAVLINYWPW